MSLAEMGLDTFLGLGWSNHESFLGFLVEIDITPNE